MTYRVYVDEFCPEFIEWLKAKFVVLHEDKNSFIIDLQHNDSCAEEIVKYIGMMMYEQAYSVQWDIVTHAIISMCPWM